MRWLLVFCVACHSSSAVSPDAAAPVSIDDIVAACEVNDACAIGAGGADNLNRCLESWTQGRPALSAQVVHCMAAAAGNCAMARACVGEVARSNPSCSAPTSCTGDTLSQCGFGVEILTDCTVSGTHCVTSGSGAACAINNTCTADACNGTKITRCKGSFTLAGDCAVVGESCVLTGTAPDQTSECGGTGPACTTDRVDGNALVSCDFGFEHRVECSAAVPGGTLQTGMMPMGGTVRYCGLGAACLPGAAVATCTNNTLTVCAFGAVQTFDCTALGYTGCGGNANNRCEPKAFF